MPLFLLVLLAMDTVKLDSGKIAGTEANGVASFKGIPYVAPGRPTPHLVETPAHTRCPLDRHTQCEGVRGRLSPASHS